MTKNNLKNIAFIMVAMQFVMGIFVNAIKTIVNYIDLGILHLEWVLPSVVGVLVLYLIFSRFIELDDVSLKLGLITYALVGIPILILVCLNMFGLVFVSLVSDFGRTITQALSLMLTLLVNGIVIVFILKRYDVKNLEQNKLYSIYNCLVVMLIIPAFMGIVLSIPTMLFTSEGLMGFYLIFTMAGSLLGVAVIEYLIALFIFKKIGLKTFRIRFKSVLAFIGYYLMLNYMIQLIQALFGFIFSILSMKAEAFPTDYLMYIQISSIIFSSFCIYIGYKLITKNNNDEAKKNQDVV